MNKFVLSMLLLVLSSGCMSDTIANKYNLGHSQVYIQSEFPSNKPFKYYLVNGDVELKMNIEDYVVVRIDKYTYRFVPKSDIENRLRNQMYIGR